MKNRWLGWATLGSGAAYLLVAGCDSSQPAGPAAVTPAPRPFTYTISPSVKPRESVLKSPGGRPDRPVEAVADARGVQSEFVGNEVIVQLSAPGDRSALDAFLRRHPGTVIETLAVPPSNHPDLPPMAPPTPARELVVRLEPSAISSVDLSSFPSNVDRVVERAASSAGSRWSGAPPIVGGASTISSPAAAQLLALVAAESAQGLLVSPNFISRPQGILNSTKEQPTAAPGFVDAFDNPRFQSTGSKSNVLKAWQIFEGFRGGGRAIPTIFVAVIDGGFWLDEAGHPYPDPKSGGLSDFPAAPAQYDFEDDDRVAGGANPTTCTNDAACPWHGNNSASVAIGAVNNRAGAAGTAGTSGAQPILLRVSGTDSQLKHAVQTATAWGADVISISMAMDCDEVFCLTWHQASGFYGAFLDATSAGKVVVAAAGNDNKSASTYGIEPCGIGPVICVGALVNEGNSRMGYSNYGDVVDIWAPTEIQATPNPASAPDLAVHGGTSASTPFVAGVVAMMKAMNRSLTADQVNDLLRKDGWAGPANGAVAYHIDAFRAVLGAAGGRLPADSLEGIGNNSPGTAKSLFLGSYRNLTLPPGDYDHYRFTLTDYAKLDISLAYMSLLARPNIVLIPESDVGAPSGVVESGDAVQHAYHADALAPGSYRFLISAPGQALYDLTLGSTITGLFPDVFDVRAPNDSPQLPSSIFLDNPAGGDFEVNLHNDADVDHYSIDLTNAETVFSYWAFSILSTDMPLQVTHFDEINQTLETIASAKASTTIKLVSGFNKIRVSGTRGRYIMSFTQKAKGGNPFFFGKLRDVRWYDPSDPAPRWLIDDRELYRFTPDLAERNVTLYGGSGQLKLSLIDESATILARSVQGFVGSGDGGGLVLVESLHLPDAIFTPAGLTHTYDLMVERVDANQGPVAGLDGQAPLPAIPYKLGR